MDPIFSVIIPTYNREDLVQRAIESVLNQTFSNFEVLVIDDASSDNTNEVVSRYNDKRVMYKQLAINKGVSAARNLGIKSAKGTYISFLDSDDAFLPGFLDCTYSVLKDTDSRTGFSWTGTIKISEQQSTYLSKKETVKTIWHPIYSSTDQAYEDCLSRDPIWGTGHGVTIKKSVFDDIGLLDENLKAREDIDLLIRLVNKYQFRVIPKHLVKIFSDSDIRVDSSFLNKADAYKKIYQKHSSFIQKNKISYFFFNRMISKNLLLAGKHIQSLPFQFNILRKNLTQLDNYTQLLKTFLRSVQQLLVRR